MITSDWMRVAGVLYLVGSLLVMDNFLEFVGYGLMAIAAAIYIEAQANDDCK